MTTDCVPCEQQRLAQQEIVPTTKGDGERAEWSGPIGIENQRTGDGRRIETNALRWDTLPIPLRWAMQDFGAHDGAYVVGKIESIERLSCEEANERLEATGRDALPESFKDAVIIWGEGVHDLGGEYGREAFRQVDEGLTPGISMDLDDIVIEEEDGDDFTITEGRVRAATQVAIPAFEGARVAVSRSAKETFDPAERLEDLNALVDNDASFNWVDDVGGLPQYIKRIEKHLEKKGMTESRAIATAVNVVKKMCATGDINFPGAQQVNAGSRAEACAAVADWERKKAQAKAEAGDTLVASAAHVFDASWFEDPRLDAPTGLTVTDDGRVYGHIALWDTCHIANPQGPKVCTQPPRSRSNYAYFKTGAVKTTAGDVAVGKITMNTLHAGQRLRAVDTQHHYEHTGIVGAYVNAGEDRHGIWVAGAAHPDADQTTLKAAPVSGDWRTVAGGLELVGALSVNVPGFPVPRARALVASGEVQSLVASGMVEVEERTTKTSVGEVVVNVGAEMSNEALRELRDRFREMDRADAAAALAAKVNRLAQMEKVRRVQRKFGLAFAYNPDQWRVPRGNPEGGRWIDMPDIAVGDLEGELMAALENAPDTDDVQKENLTESLGTAVEAAERASSALRNSDGDAALGAANEASVALSEIQSDIDNGDLFDDATKARLDDRLADANSALDVVIESDLSLLGQETDIGAGDTGLKARDGTPIKIGDKVHNSVDPSQSGTVESVKDGLIVVKMDDGDYTASYRPDQIKHAGGPKGGPSPAEAPDEYEGAPPEDSEVTDSQNALRDALDKALKHVTAKKVAGGMVGSYIRGIVEKDPSELTAAEVLDAMNYLTKTRGKLPPAVAKSGAGLQQAIQELFLLLNYREKAGAKSMQAFAQELRRHTFAYNPDQWRVPKGNPEGGRWVDMPGIEIDRLGATIGDVFERVDVGSDKESAIGASIDEGLDAGDRIKEALNSGDGDAATAAARDADAALSKLERQLQDAVESGGIDDADAGKIGDALANAREANDLVMNSDLSLLGDDSFDDPGADIGGEDKEVVGDEPDPRDVLDNTKPGDLISIDDGMATLKQTEDGNWEVVDSKIEGVDPGMIMDDNDVYAGGDVKISKVTGDVPEAPEYDDPVPAVEGLASIDPTDYEAQRDALNALPDGTTVEMDDGEFSTTMTKKDGKWEVVSSGLADMEDPDLEPATADEIMQGYIDTYEGDPREDRTPVIFNEGDPNKEPQWADLYESESPSPKPEPAAEDTGYNYGDHREGEGPIKVGDRVSIPTKTEKGTGVTLERGEGEVIGKGDAPGSVRVRLDDGTEKDMGWGGVDKVNPNATAEDKDGDGKTGDEETGSQQQKAAQKMFDTAELLESSLFDEAESGSLTDEQYDTIGRQLEDLMRKMDALRAGISDGNYNANDLSAAQQALSQFEALLMSVADGPGWSDETANNIGQRLDDLFADLGNLATTLQGSTEPPPFAARKYVRQWLGRRGIRLGRKPTIMV
jgi:hypothetical protein